MSADLKTALAKGIEQANLPISQDQQGLLLAYLQQLAKWNKAFNLSGIKSVDDMLPLHILDCLVLLPYLQGNVIADVGTGAGLPGLVLAICCPDKKFILIDSNSKKTRFMFQTAALLGLDNVSVEHSRVEDYASKTQVDIVTSRAFASLVDFVSSCQHLLADNGRFLAMKGQYPEQELAELPPAFNLTDSHQLQVPGLQAQRYLLDIRRRNS